MWLLLHSLQRILRTSQFFLPSSEGSEIFYRKGASSSIAAPTESSDRHGIGNAPESQPVYSSVGMQ